MIDLEKIVVSQANEIRELREENEYLRKDRDMWYREVKENPASAATPTGTGIG